MRRKRTYVYATVCIVLGVTLSASQAEAQIRWLTGSSPQMIVSAPEAAQSIAAMAAADDTRHIVVEFGDAITPSDRQYLEGRGLELLGYLGDNAYFAAVSGRSLDVGGLARFDKLTGARAIEPNWKLHPLLMTDEAPQWALLNPGKPDEPMIPVYVLFHPDVPLASRAVSVAYRHDALVRSHIETINGLVLEIPFRNVAALAQEDTVQYIEPALPRWGEVNDSIRQNVGADIVQAPPYSLDGAGVMVLVYDGGKARATHNDFSGDLGSRVTIGPSDTSSMSDHATHVSCTIGGNGTASAGLYRGMAPACSLLSYAFEQEGGLQEGFLYTDPGDLEADYGEAISMFSAVISNNSIGTNTAPNGFPCEWEGNYGVTSALIDDVVRGALGEPIRVVWANGNERSSGRCGTTYHTTAPPACAKNHITVGAMNSNDDSVTYFTSWGPTDDGRLKPDLSAPGCQSDGDGTVTSCSSSSDTAYTGKCGTSMACPTAAGVTALVLQDFRNQFPGEPDPLPSTMKALLVQNVEDLENPGPDYKTGYGIIRAQPTVDFMRMGYFLEGEVGQDESYLFLVYAEAGDPELKITLTWDDPPGMPNVYPNLVNDLDLIVTSPSSVRHYPWTLDPDDPSADAVQTVEDHANNIEQVYLLDPEPGAWQVEVFGHSVPQGPQLFSACASPLLVNCSSQGIIRLDKAKYSCNDAEVGIKVVDCDLNTDDQTVETVDVVIESDSDDADQGDPPVIVTLTETAAETADFRGSVPLTTTTPGDPSSLYIQPSDEIRGIYVDADDGEGGTDVEVTDTAIVDCDAPIISNVQVSSIEPRDATVEFDTNEPAQAVVFYDTFCGGTIEASSAGFQTHHVAHLSGLEDNTTYFFSVQATDEAGNTAVDDNGGNCYTFTTLEIPDFFTEQFGGNNDLDYLTLTFEPSGSVDFYDGCTEPIESLPTDPASGTMLSISEDGYQQVTLGDGQTVSLYGVSYSSFYVCDNGYITFTGSDSDYTESLEDHFDMPRVSPLFDDFSVDDAGGNVSWKQLSDRAAVTYENVPEYGTSNSNTFQVELFFDGTITISYLEVAVSDGLAGLSEGEGLSPDFYATDLSEMGPCGPKPPTAMPVEVTGPVGADSIAITLEATDDGLPDPPAALTYIVTSLPTHGDLYEPGFGQITSVPHELADNGNELTYQPEPTYHGLDSFQYVANDGGVPPEGGDSDPATVSITVGGAAWDPQAFNVSASTPASTPVDVVLNATDPNGDPLTYFIESLPASGTLSDPGAGAITEVPYELVGGGHIVQYAPPVGEETLTALFTYSAADATASSNIAMVTVTVGGPAWEPVAYPVTAATPISTPVDVTLNAIDPNGDPLTYFIESLPLEGTLDDPGAGAITGVPYELVAGGAVVRYTPPIYQNLVAEFEYSARDATAGSNLALVTVTVGGPMTFFEDDFETDKGWTIENIELETGAWERVIPIAGIQGAPSSDYDGSGRCYLTERVSGADVDGGPTRLISPTVNVAGVIDPKLRYARWFTCDDADIDRLDVEISNDNGASWVLIESVPDTVGWVEQTIEMVDYITPGAQMKVRFGAMDNPNNSITEGAIDAIEIWGLPEIELPGDYDGNSVVDLADFAYFLECMTGPDAGPATPECEVFYFNADDDVDLGDFAGFQAILAEFY